VGVSPAWGDELTIFGSGTSTHNGVPIYAYNADTSGDRSEFVVPSSMLTNMSGKNITGLTFYCANFPSWGSKIPQYLVYLKEVGSETLTAYSTETDATVVYTGAFTLENGLMTVTFTTPYTYNGGHLLIGTKVSTAGSYIAKANSTFYGSTSSDVTCNKSNSTGNYFLPKTTFTYESATVAGPAFVVKDGSTKLSSPYAYNFGLATAGTTKTFTLTNPGTEATPIALSTTGNIGASIGEATSIAAGGEVTLTLTMPDANASGTVTVTPTGEGLSAFTFNVSGTVKDPSKMFEDFSSKSLPDGWSKVDYNSSYKWTFTNEYANVGYNECSLTTPNLTFSAGELFFFDARNNYSWGTSGYVKVQTSTDGETFVDLQTFSAASDLEYNTWKNFSVTIPSADIKYIRFLAKYSDIDNVYGGKTSDGANFAINTDGSTQSLGVAATGGKLEKTFTITNSGNVDLVISVAKSGDAYAQKTLLFSNDKDWSNVYLYAWNDGGALTPAFPGNKQDATGGTNEFGQPLYSLIVPKDATKIIVSNGNNGSGNQSQDITIDFNKTGLYLDGSYAGVFYGDGDIIVKAKKDDINGSAKFTVGLNSSTAGIKNGSVELTFDALNGGSPFTIPVTGTVLPAEMPVEEFTDGLPANWTNASWTFANGEATGKSSSAYLTTPKLSFSAGDFIIIKAKRYDSDASDYLTVQGSNDNGSTWTAYNKKLQNADGLTYPDYGTIVLNDIPTSVNKLRFTGYYCIVDEIHGLNYAPVLSVTTGDPAQAVITPANYDFGETSANASVTYNFANAGAGTIDITNVAITGDGAAAYSTNWTESTTAPFDLVITRIYDAERISAQDAVVTVTTSEGDFVINVTGTDMAAGANFAIDTDGTTPEDLGLVTANEVAKKNFTITNSGNAPLVVTFTDDTDFYASTVSFTRPNDAGWGDNVYIYAWNSSDEPLLGAWPGKLVTESELNNMNERVYTARLPQNTYGIIFHDNTDAHKTRDIKSGVGDDPEFKQIMGIYLDNKDVQKPTFWKNEDLTIPAGESKTFTVRMASATAGEKSGNIALAFTASNATEFTIPVKGIVTATGSEVVDFNTAIPARWENQDNGWSIYNNEAAKCTGKKNLTTQKLDFSDEDNPFFVMKVKASDSGSGDYVTVEGSTDNGATWEAFDKKTYSYPSDFGANTGDYSTIVVSIPNTVNKLRFNGYYVLIDEIVGLKYSANDPTIAVKDDEDALVTSGTMKDFGWANTAQSATYYITNSGTGTLTISEISAVDGFTAATAGDVMTVAAGADPLALTITMTNAAVGAKSGTFTITTDGGNFEIPVKGFIYGSKNLVDFTDASQYQGWTGVNVTDGVAAVSSTAIETTPFSAEAAEKLYVEIKGSSSYGSKSLSYSYSRDGGANWSAATNLIASTYSNIDDQVFTISDIADAEAASTVKIRFTGSGLGINHIYGFTALSVPVMSIDKTADYNFGMQTEAAEYVITVTNNGTATLNNLTATLATGTDYSVVITKPDGESTTTITDGKATVPAGQQAIITVTQLFDANNGLASLSDVLTISGDDVESEEINLSGKTRDGSKWYVDFASGIPASFVEKGSWSYTSQQAYVYSESALVSQTLTIAANEKVQFDVKTMSYSTPSLKVRHSLDGGLTWSAYTDLTNEDGVNSSTYTTLNYGFGNTDASAVVMVEFLGANVYLDNIYGGALNNEAPMIQVKKGSSVVESGVAEAFGTILSETSAEYTIKNIGHGTLTITSPVTVTGVATATVSETSLANNESATLTITMPVEAPYGDKAGVVTVETSLGDFVINYTATTKNPNTLNATFDDYALPAGWYNNGWSCAYSQYMSRADRNSDTDFITQKLQVADTSDALKFDAQKYGSYYASSTVLKVSYSTDRVNWTEIGDYASEMTTSWKTFEISGLEAGEYYLKFTGRYANVDNIIGWEKVADIDHDLYVTATSFPAATDKGESTTITATVTSLRTAETGVYAKLFIDGEQEGEASAAQDIALNGTKTFSFTYAIPEKKTAQIKVYYSNDAEAFATAENIMKVNYTMDETSTPEAFDAGIYDVKLTYTKDAEKLGTICLPFATTTEELSEAYGTTVKIYELTGRAENVITFNGVDELTAGTPYLIYSDEALSGEKSFEDKTVVAAAGNSEASSVTFQGIYAPTSAGNWGDEWYGVTSEGKIAKGTETTTMKGLRAYFTGNVADARIFIMDDEGTTRIATINRGGVAIDDAAVYNLNGQKVQNAKKGLYIVNGRKVVIK
jgi:hypothetical protein